MPNGITSTIRNQATGSAVTVAMVDGGFDPVAVEATAGDLLTFDIDVVVSAGTLAFSRVVPGTRRPKVVRTNPPRGKRDVALNASIIIVFSEPVNEATVTSESIRLLLGTTAVAGRLELRDGDHLMAAFVPLTPARRRS